LKKNNTWQVREYYCCRPRYSNLVQFVLIHFSIGRAFVTIFQSNLIYTYVQAKNGFLSYFLLSETESDLLTIENLADF